MISFEGVLPSAKHPFRIRVDILDWDFVDYPRIEILDEPEGFRPHVNENRCLCYLSHGSLVFDRHTPLANLEQCLDLAAQELDRQINTKYRYEESRYEFVRYWSENWFYMMGTVCPKSGLHQTGFTPLDAMRWLISDDRDEIGRFWQVFNKDSKAENQTTYPAWVITLDNDPWLDRNGPPKTWRELWAWLEMVDSRSAQRLYSLANKPEFAKPNLAMVIFRYQSKWFGIKSTIPEEARRNHALTKLKRGGRSSLASYLKDGRGVSITVETFTTVEVTEDFIHGRNLAGGESLKGLSINLVGAGAIGGFLAQQLSRLGAGSGGGVLRIIDTEILSSENLGRHLLGLDMLFLPKATALARFLKQQFPMSEILDYLEDARQFPHLFDCDILIDATGEEPLSLVLNDRHQKLLKNGTSSAAMLFVWVLGNGEVVQGLLSDGGNHACYDCLNLPNKNELERQRFPILKKLPETQFIGCHAMRPYAVTAPSMAASLGTQMVADWKVGNPSPRFRTMYLGKGKHLYNLKADSDPDRLTRCATCSRI